MCRNFQKRRHIQSGWSYRLNKADGQSPSGQFCQSRPYANPDGTAFVLGFIG